MLPAEATSTEAVAEGIHRACPERPLDLGTVEAEATINFSSPDPDLQEEVGVRTRVGLLATSSEVSFQQQTLLGVLRTTTAMLISTTVTKCKATVFTTQEAGDSSDLFVCLFSIAEM